MTLPDSETTLEISTQQCDSLLRSLSPPLLIDCREIYEYEHCHIASSKLVPLSIFQEHIEAEFPTPETPAIIYCHHGVRSLTATRYLRDLGYHQTFSMIGGIDLWSTKIDSQIPRY